MRWYSKQDQRAVLNALVKSAQGFNSFNKKRSSCLYC